MATVAAEALKQPRQVSGIPIIGNALSMAKDPGRFFYECYRKYGSVYRLKVMNNTYTVLAGVEAANFMGTREGRDSLRSKEFWQGLVNEWGAKRTLTGEDGETHQKLRSVMRHGYSRESVRGRYPELVAITDSVIARDWPVGTMAPVLQNMQYIVTEQLGAMLTGTSPREYVGDIRTTILYILNILVTRQRPRFMLKDPRYRHAKERVSELGRRMIAEYRETKDQRDPARRNLVDDIMEAHEKDPDLIPASDLILSLTGPFVAGLDTVANTTAAFIYGVLKHPEVHARVRQEADALFAQGDIDEPDLKRIPAIDGAIMEAMRMYPIAVAQMRTATRDFAFAGHQIREGELLYVATAVPHYMEEYYPNPDKFDIDRYAKPRAEHLKPGVYSPYGRGTHTCLGKTLAEVQMSLSMARLFYLLDLELESPDYVLKTKVLPTPGPSMKFKVRVKGRRH
ncbi:MAG TPA: cytochrome P450 [Steroidobacteraceae bacterium]|jgi:cytochrome P450|nr:cytochrome P450 [Steroidobacteraceae bacterium]